MYRPIDLSRKLKICTSTIRNYEDQGFIPESTRISGNHRRYNQHHLNYLECILSMKAGFSRDETHEIMMYIQDKRINDALLLCSHKQAVLIKELRIAQDTVKLFTSGSIYNDKSLKKPLAIKEVVELTGVADTTIRHWEREGLLNPKRGKTNNYRYYDIDQITRILIIRTIKTAVWSLDHVRNVLKQFDGKKPEEVYKVSVDSLNYLYRLNIYQHQGVHALYQLCLDEGLIANHYDVDYTFNINLKV